MQGRTAFLVGVVICTAAVFYPSTSHAGILSGLFHFLSGSETNAQIDTSASSAVLPLLESQQNPSAADNGDMNANNDIQLQMTEDAALVAPRNPIGIFTDDIHDEIVVYTVKSGDSPIGIAKRFGITLNTLLWANDIKNASSIRVGDELIILPVSGVQYQVKKGDTIESIAKRFKPKDETDITSVVSDILQYNGLAINEKLEVGATIIIPDGEISLPSSPSSKPAGGSVVPRSLGLPEYIGYFLRPVIGGRNVRATKSNSHGLHGYNGVDLGVSYGTSIMASAEGTVIRAKSSGWNGGYGNYVVITHPNGTQTLYAHMSALLVTIGQHVAQGAKIGFVGSSGNSTGPHVHFEIRGAKNPF